MPAGKFTQDDRFLSLTTTLGKDVLLINSFSISDRVSGIYRMELDVLTKEAFDPKRLLGQQATLTLNYDPYDPSGKRYFNGIVTEVGVSDDEIRDEAGVFYQARLVIVPKLWLLTLNSHFRVFEGKTVPDIVAEVLGQYGIQTRPELESYVKWDFCYQYRETDFNFISRLMEEEGIFYFFEHGENSHTMVLADKTSSFKPCADQPEANYAPDYGAGDADYVASWEIMHDLRSGAYQLWDWHFENAPRRSGYRVQTASAVAGNTAYQVADYPVRTVPPSNKIGRQSDSNTKGSKFVRVRMEEVETENPVFRGVSDCRAFNAGKRFTLKSKQNGGDYVITAVNHTGSQYPPYLFGMESGVMYNNTLTCIKYTDQTVYRPPRTAQRSFVQGPQTALVIEGPDKYGRMRVKFPWGEPETSSAWLRVAQRWAGPQWGTIFLPRVGHEVIVDFIDGDPDHPLIVGSLYNAQNMPPYALPDKYTQSGIKTRSMTADGSTQGGSDEFNELRFEDLQGKEDIYFHAQKDFHRVVENDDDLKVGHDQTIEIKNHRTEVVKDGNEKVTIEKGKREVFVNTGDDLHQVKMGNRKAIVDMGNDSLNVKMGNHIRKIDLGKSETEALQSIELKVGANSIKIDQTGITLDGLMINFKGKVMIKSEAPIQQMNGNAMVKIQGGITMIN